MSNNIEILSNSWVDWNMDNRNQRYGQYVINTYFPSVKCASLFYERDSGVAFHKLFNHIHGYELIDDWVENT